MKSSFALVALVLAYTTSLCHAQDISRLRRETKRVTFQVEYNGILKATTRQTQSFVFEHPLAKILANESALKSIGIDKPLQQKLSAIVKSFRTEQGRIFSDSRAGKNVGDPAELYSESVKKIDAEISKLLTKKRMNLMNAMRDVRHSFINLETDQIPDSQKDDVVRKCRDLQKQLEEHETKLVKQSIAELSEVLTETQRITLQSLLGEPALDEQFCIDLWYHNLLVEPNKQNAEKEVDSKQSFDIDLTSIWIPIRTVYQLDPQCQLYHDAFLNPPSSNLKPCFYLLIKKGVSKEMNFVQAQNQIGEIFLQHHDEHYEIYSEYTREKDPQKKSWLRAELDDAGNAATQKVLDELLPHQRQRLDQIKLQYLIQHHGLPQILTNSSLTQNLKITEKQKQEIHKRAKEAAKTLKKNASKIETFAFLELARCLNQYVDEKVLQQVLDQQSENENLAPRLSVLQWICNEIVTKLDTYKQ